MDFKKAINKSKDTLNEIKEKAEDAGEYLKEDKGHFKEIGKGFGSGFKEEMKDLKKIMDSKDLIFYKTETLAVVLRKLGGLHEFLEAFDKLTKEGYILVWQEAIQPVAIPFTQKLYGSFYYFQNQK